MTSITRRKINIFLILAWSIPLFFFVPCSGSGLAPQHQFFVSHDGCFSPLVMVIGYSSLASIQFSHYSGSISRGTLSVDYGTNPYWIYWFVIVAVNLLLTAYLRRDILSRIHNATKI
jgi:hypothetical protein